MEYYEHENDEADRKRYVDLSCCELRTLDVELLRLSYSFRPELIRKLVLYGNSLNILPTSISQFCHLQELDVSSNEISWITGEISQLRSLKVLEARNNRLFNLPKEFTSCSNLKVLNLSGNLYTDFPPQVFELTGLSELYMGGNKLVTIPSQIQNLKRLEILYVGGNELEHVSSQLRKLKSLRHLFLCDNQLQTLPPDLGQLKRLESLSLHKNKFKTLPIDIIMLTNLQELTLRDNPLVNTFVKKLEFSPPSLLELSGRVVKTKNITYKNEVPKRLRNYLDSARRCVNPNCDGVYFDSGVKCVKFVDFCGRFRVPLEQYLCSPNEQDEDNRTVDARRLQKVLLPSDVGDSD